MTDAATSPITDLEVIPRENALAVLTDPVKFDEFYTKVADEVAKHTPDLSTSAGRKAIAALAFKVTKTKTAIDEAGKKLTEDARKQIATADESRREIRARLDALRDTVRKPLTEWEEAEEARQRAVQATLDDLRQAAIVHADETVATVTARLESTRARTFDEITFGGHQTIAVALRDNAVAALESAIARLTKAEEDARELARLREQEEARKREEAATREREETARKEREARERQEREEADRKEREAAQAREAEERRQRQAAEAEATRLRQENEARQRAEAQTRADEERRQKNRAHVAKVKGEAKVAAMAVIEEHGREHEPDEKLAVAIVKAIADGKIPHVIIKF